MSKRMKSWVLMLMMAACSLGAFSASASAHDCRRPVNIQPRGWYWKTVTVYVHKQVPYRVKVRYVRPCGTVYYKWITKYRTVKVPVTKRIKVWY